MSLLKKLGALFSAGGAASNAYAEYYYVRCRRCGEVIRVRLNTANEPSAEYDEAGNTTGYVYRKVLIGRQRCFQPIEVTMTFDARRKVLSREAAGGEFVTAEAYEEAMQADA